VQLVQIDEPAPNVHPTRRFKHPAAVVDLRLPIEWQMIGVFADEHVCQESGSGHATLDRARRCRRLHDRIAAGAGELGAHVPNHFEAHRLEFEHLADIFAQMLELATTVRAA